MYVSDFDHNGSTEQLVTHFLNGREYPYCTRDEMVKQMPGLKKKYLSFAKYASATAGDIFGDSLERAKLFEANTFETVYIENKGNGKFDMTPLPAGVQFSSVNASIIEDFNGDGNLDMLLAGNFYPLNVQMVRMDASYDSLLLGNGSGKFEVVPNKDSGICLRGEVRKLQKIKVKGQTHYLAFRNHDSILSLSINK